jgi:acetolactate synthase-1/2/3 large subunit
MATQGQVSPLPPATIAPSPPPAPLEVAAAARLVAAANRPMIMTGGGAQHAADAVRALAEELDAPVAAFRGGRGVVAEDHALGISSYAAWQLWPQTDVLIGIGSRLEMPYMRWTGMMTLIDRPQPPPHLVRIDIDPAEMRRLVPHAALVADAEAGTRALLAAVRRLRGRHTAHDREQVRSAIAAAKSSARAEYAKVQPQISYLDAIREVLPRDGFFVGELSQMGFASYFGFPVYTPRTYVSEGFQGTLGFGFPTALGVKAAHPDRAVIAVTGDGGFMFAVQELATAVQENLALVVLVFNNRAYGNVLRDQQARYDNRIIGALLENPSFADLAQVFGVSAARAASPAELKLALGAALAAGKPALIEVEVLRGSEVSPWEFIHPPPRG